MADQIEINIYLKDQEGSSTNGDNVTGSGGNIPGMSQAGDNKSKDTKAMASLGKYVASQTISVFLNDTKNAISQNIGLVTGKTELQERVNFGMQVVQQGVNTYKNAMAGAAAFAALGLSGPLGAIISGMLSIGSDVIDYAFKINQRNIQENLENRQINQTLSRFGAGYNKSRSGV